MRGLATNNRERMLCSTRCQLNDIGASVTCGVLKWFQLTYKLPLQSYSLTSFSTHVIKSGIHAYSTFNNNKMTV